MTGFDAAMALLSREMVRMARQPSRIVATVGAPLLLWVFFASGFAETLGRSAGDPEGGPGAAAFLLPGVVTLVVMFSAIFAAISLIQDREAGFLQAAMVSPAPAWSIVAGKAAGGALIAAAQAGLLLLAAPLVGLEPGFAGWALAALAGTLAAVAVTSLGLAAAWLVDSVQGFHGVMNLVLMPLWLLSGAVFDVAQAAGWLRVLTRANPLYWATEAMRTALEGQAAPLPFLVTAVFAAVMLILAWAAMKRASRPGRGAPVVQ